MLRFRPQRVNLRSNGVAKVLGDCEADMLELLWKTPPLSVNQVREWLLRSGHAISFNATMTILNRMVEKGVLAKRKRKMKGGKMRFVYIPTADRPTFLQWISREVFRRCFADAELFSAAGFTDALDTLSKKDRDMLKRFLERSSALRRRPRLSSRRGMRFSPASPDSAPPKSPEIPRG